jgi:hypothetical protein
MEVPIFLRLEGDSLVFNKPNCEFVYYVPENYFDAGSKNPIAEVYGQYVSMIGLCNYRIIEANGTNGKLMPFNFPTVFMCKPYKIEKVKDLKLETDREPNSYRVLRFKEGDEVVSDIRVPQIIDNAELLFKLVCITARFPTTIPYDEGWKVFIDNIELQGTGYGLNAQLFGIVWSELCRDASDPSKPFRMTNMKDMNNYKMLSVKLLPNYISPYTSIVSENWDESLRSAILMKDKEDLPYSPVEKIVTM